MLKGVQAEPRQRCRPPSATVSATAARRPTTGRRRKRNNGFRGLGVSGLGVVLIWGFRGV